MRATRILPLTGNLEGRRPIRLHGSAHWKSVINFEALVRHGMISAEDLKLFRFVDDTASALKMLQECLTDDKVAQTPAIACSRTPEG